MRKNSHGKEVSTIAKETTLEGKAKGEAISTATRSNRHEEKVKANSKSRPAKANKGSKLKGNQKKGYNRVGFV